MKTLELLFEVMKLRDSLRAMPYGIEEGRTTKTDYAKDWDEAISEALVYVDYLLKPYGQLLAQGFAKPEPPPAPQPSPAPANLAEVSTLTTKINSHLAHLAEGRLGSTPASLRVREGSAKVHVEIGTHHLFFDADAARCLGRHLMIAAGVMNNMGGVE